VRNELLWKKPSEPRSHCSHSTCALVAEHIQRVVAPSSMMLGTFLLIVGSVASQSTVPSHRRELQTAVSTVADLTSALANTAVGRIVLASGTYYLTAQLSVTRSVVLEAAVAGSVVLDAQASYSSRRRVLYINPGLSGVVQLIGLSITRGYVLGGVPGQPDGSQRGGGVNVYSGTVTISSCTISGNSADDGGGIYVFSGTVTLSSCTISGNTAVWGGGVIVWYQQGGTGTVAISSCTISGNTVSHDGGGVNVIYGTVTITSSSIYGNTAGNGYYWWGERAGYGGGVNVNSGTARITSSSIYGNTAYQGGQNVYVGTRDVAHWPISAVCF